MTEELRNIDRIIIRHLLNEAGRDEQEYLLNWLKQDAENRRHFFTIKESWEQANNNAPIDVNTDDSWEALQKQMGSDSPAIKKPIIMRLFKYAAAIILISVLGITAYIITNKIPGKAKEVVITEIITGNGQKKEITLPDGTRVWLNSGTAFSYSSDYGKSDRQVNLTGEAFFEVTRDESKTFIVKAGEVTIKVLGTSFNVNCYPESKVVETTVISGIVSVENDKIEEGNEIVILNKLEKGTYVKDEHRMLIERNNTQSVKPITLKKISLNEEESAYISSWKDQTLSFDNENFEEMAVKLQRWFGVTIKIEDENLKNYRYKGKFENVRSIFQVLEVVRLATPITYEYNEKTKEITIKETK